MRSEIMLTVNDVRQSAVWYTSLLNAESDHGGEEFDRIVAGGAVLLMLHHRGEGEHGIRLPRGNDGRVGDGVVVWIYVNDVDAVHRRALDMKAEVLSAPPPQPPAPQWREFSLRDPDGYTVSIAQH